MKNMVGILMSVVILASALAALADAPKELLKEYHGEVVLPEELYQTYAGLVAAFAGGKPEEIEKFCLPGKIKIVSKSRPQNRREYGEDINLPFLKDGFHKFILNLRKESDREYLIRTGSTAMWFFKTGEGKWKLARYLDKPIQ